MVTVQVRMEPEPGAQFLASIESLAESDARRERAARRRATGAEGAPDTEEPPADEVIPLSVMTERRCRAMTRLAAAAADADRRAGDPPRREVVVMVDATVLADDEAAGRAALEGGPALSPAQARRLACDAAVTTIVTHGGQVLAQGRARRFATRAQRRALLMRDGGCAVPGCEEVRIERLHAHHLRHWLHGGRTDVSNLVLLCDVHHGLVHDEDLVMSRRGRELVVHDRQGRRIWQLGADDPLATVTRLRSRGTAPDDLTDLLSPGAALPAALPYDGERLDLRHAVWALLAYRNTVRRRAA
jgi:hypothetical protein